MCFRKFVVATLQAVLAFLVFTPFLLSQTRPKPPKSVRLYVFDNGVIKGLDPATFHFKREELATTDMVVCSYLIVQYCFSQRLADSTGRPVIGDC
jgi:hypothetical protein